MVFIILIRSFHSLVNRVILYSLYTKTVNEKERHPLLGLGDVCIKLSSMTPTPPSIADIASMWYVMFRSGNFLIAYLHGKKKEASRM